MLCTIPSASRRSGPVIALRFRRWSADRMQIIGPHLAEERILQVAYAFEQSHDYHKQMALIREVD